MLRDYAICGGTFDPVHYGHLLLAECAREQLGLERVVFVPAAQGPHKDAAPRAAAEHRLAMLRAAVEGNPAFEVSDCELRRGGVSYTIETVLLMRRLYGGAPVVLIGADNLNELDTWRRIGELARLVRFAYAPRPGSPTPRAAPVPGLRHVELAMPAFAVSSTLLRERAARGQSLRYLTPPPVISYIARHELYQPA